MKKIILSLSIILSVALSGSATFAQDYPATQSAVNSIIKGVGKPVNDSFVKCVGRSPTTDELNKYTSEIINGKSTSDVDKEICASDAASSYRAQQIEESYALQKPKQEVDKINSHDLYTQQNVAVYVLGKGQDKTKLLNNTAVDEARDGLFVASEGLKTGLYVLASPGTAAGEAVDSGVKNIIDIAKNPSISTVKKDTVDFATDVVSSVVDPIVNSLVKIGNTIACGVKEIFGGNCDQPRMSQADAEKLVTQMYEQYLGREPESGGLATWTKEVMYGNGPEWVSEQIRNSVEGKARTPGGKGLSCGDLCGSGNKCSCGVNPGGYTNLGNTYDCQPCYGGGSSKPAASVAPAKSNRGPDCGDLCGAGNKCSCGVNPGGYTNLGNTFDCQPCYGGGSKTSSAPAKSSGGGRGPSCGDLCRGRACSCGVDPGGYIDIGNTYDCQPCFAK